MRFLLTLLGRFKTARFPPVFFFYRDAAALACVCQAASDAPRASKWHSAARVSPDGLVLESPSGAFDVTVAPGEDVQAAVDRCPPGGSVLLLPGTHAGTLFLTAGKVVHVFGRGHATLRAAMGAVVTSEAARGTLDGLIILREAGGPVNDTPCGVWIRGGRLRLQGCDVTCAQPDSSCIIIEGGADPLLLSCRYLRAQALFSRRGLPVT